MNNKLKYFGIVLIAIIIFSCKTEKNIVVYEDINIGKDLSIEFIKGKSFNHPTFTIWIEDINGNYLKTLFVTKSYASGIFGHKMVGDTMWIPESGESYQPAALPYWTYKKGLINNQTLFPTSKNPFVDAYTGATPKGSFKFNAEKCKKDKYILLVEVNQTWDWNKYWTNNKYPESSAYIHSAQPSIVYAVTVNDMDSVYYLNPIGHGDPKGESGRLYSDLSTITTAKQIFLSIKIKINNEIYNTYYFFSVFNPYSWTKRSY